MAPPPRRSAISYLCARLLTASRRASPLPLSLSVRAFLGRDLFFLFLDAVAVRAADVFVLLLLETVERLLGCARGLLAFGVAWCAFVHEFASCLMLSSSSTSMPCRSAAARIFFRARSFAAADSNFVWLNRASALRTCDSSLIGRCSPPSESTYANWSFRR